MINYKITFYEYWHSSSGLAGGMDSNLLVLKDADLPYVAGKTLKGLLREAAERIHHWQPDRIKQSFIDELFGEQKNAGESSTYRPTDRIYYFSDARLDAATTQLLGQQPAEIIYADFTSTAIEANTGMAKQNSLRTIEFCVPLTLYATIDPFPNDDPIYRKQLAECLQWVKRMGIQRNRGFGRCDWELLPV